MAGLFVREALARGWVHTVLVVAPGSLVDQWQDELLTKFGLHFELLEAADSEIDAFAGKPFVIARLDQLARSESLQHQLADARFDLAIIDEAHKMSARRWGSIVVVSKRYELGELIRDSVRRLVLMTATPHNGKDEDFALFLRLLGLERASGDRGSLHEGLMRRLVKEQLVHADGTPLFPQRHAQTVAYRLAPLEYNLYESVTEYVRHEMNKIAGEERRTVGFALLVLQRRLASSPEAILRSLERRRDRLAAELENVRVADDRLLRALEASLGEPPSSDSFTAEEEERWDEDVSAVATASRTAAELEAEVEILRQLTEQASAVREAELDSKWEALATLLGSDAIFDGDGRRRKVIIFTEHRDTLEYLVDRLELILGMTYDVETIHGGTTREERLAVQHRFSESERSAVLVATDSAGEGVNLQAAHLMVNYDIPWNPNRLEQRFGRIHRIGQRHDCHLWNLVTADTREGDVFATLLAKLERQRSTLGDCVFDVLGEVLRESSLSDLLVHALRGNSDRAIESELSAFDSDVRSAVERRNSVRSSFTSSEIDGLRRRMALARARSLNPLAIQEFVIEALMTLRGEIAQTGTGWSVRHVPERVRRESPTVRTRYAEVTFEPVTDAARVLGARELLAPRHPLVTALARTVSAEFGETLRRGVVLEDDRVDQSYVAVWTHRNTDEIEQISTAMCVLGDANASQAAMNPAALSSLAVASSGATAAEIEAVGRALTVALSEGDDLVAVAYVRGTASTEVAARWRSAREGLRSSIASSEDDVTLLHDPWDVMAEGDGAWEFVGVRLVGVSSHPRAHERGAAQSLGAAYRLEDVETRS